MCRTCGPSRYKQHNKKKLKQKKRILSVMYRIATERLSYLSELDHDWSCLCCEAGLDVRVAQAGRVQSHVVLRATGQRSASGVAFSTARETPPSDVAVVLDSASRFVWAVRFDSVILFVSRWATASWRAWHMTVKVDIYMNLDSPLTIQPINPKPSPAQYF